MLKIFSTINFALGFGALTAFAVWCGGDVRENFSGQAFLMFLVGTIALLAAGMGLKRMSILLHGWAGSAYMCWAIYALRILNEQVEIDTAEKSLKGLFGIFAGPAWTYPALLVGCGLTCTVIGTWIDEKGGIALLFQAKKNKQHKERQENNRPSNKPKPAAAQNSYNPLDNTSIDPKLMVDVPAPSGSDSKKIIRCTGCNKKIKVKTSQGKVRCPACQAVMSI